MMSSSFPLWRAAAGPAAPAAAGAGWTTVPPAGVSEHAAAPRKRSGIGRARSADAKTHAAAVHASWRQCIPTALLLVLVLMMHVRRQWRLRPEARRKAQVNCRSGSSGSGVAVSNAGRHTVRRATGERQQASGSQWRAKAASTIAHAQREAVAERAQ
jgi:hypothetical protein